MQTASSSPAGPGSAAPETWPPNTVPVLHVSSLTHQPLVNSLDRLFPIKANSQASSLPVMAMLDVAYLKKASCS
jgi:hypothetical protein